MTDTPDLQMDRAEFDAAGSAACVMCSIALSDSYYEVNAQTVCAECCAELRAIGTQGSPFSRAARAVVAGVGAAFAGTVLYYAILALSGYEFGLIAILVGLAVGKAVNWGAYGRGGWRYQTLAVALTYLSIVSSYVPLIVAEMRKPVASAEAGEATGIVAPAASDSTRASAIPDAGAAQPTLAQAVVAIVVLIALVCALPFLSGAQNIIGIIIIGIGVYQAWKLNRRQQFTITGPHALAAPAVATHW